VARDIFTRFLNQYRSQDWPGLRRPHQSAETHNNTALSPPRHLVPKPAFDARPRPLVRAISVDWIEVEESTTGSVIRWPIHGGERLPADLPRMLDDLADPVEAAVQMDSPGGGV